MTFLKVWRWPLHWQILLGLLAGALLGLALGAHAVSATAPTTAPADRGAFAARAVVDTAGYQTLKLLGDLFLNALKLVVVPLVVSSVLLAVARLSGAGQFGRLGAKALAYYGFTTLVAVLIGLAVSNLFKPGVGSDGTGILVGRDVGAFAGETGEVSRRVAGNTAGSAVLTAIRSLVPDNLVAAAAANQMLGLIVVGLVVGVVLGRYDGDGKQEVMGLLQGVNAVTLRVVAVVLVLTPFGVLGLVGATFAENYARLRPDDRFAEFGGALLTAAVAAFVGLLIHLFGSMSILLGVVARVNPLRHFRAMLPALTTAFSTSSSNATLPVTLECLEQRAGVSDRVAGLTLPLGATVNMDGTALYECVAALFICRAFGVDLDFGQQFFVVLMALLTSIGVAGIPSASLVAITVILQGVETGLPPGSLPPGVSLVAGMGLLFVFDRPLDMVRTAVNVFSDSVGAVVVARTEGERTKLVG